MQYIAESELILNKRGAVYHLDLLPEELAGIIITVGDPGRVKEVSKHFDEIEYTCQHREFVTHTGRIGNKRLSVVSTGIGTDNIDIVMNELDALVNIDLAARTVKSPLTTLQVIRIGTAGSLQEDIPVDHYVASTHGIGTDNLLHFYRNENNDEENQLIQSFITQIQLHNHTASPYISSASVGLLKHFVEGFHQGITVTCPGFYGPQGRILRLGLSNPAFIDRLSAFSFGTHRICNFEMETAGIYGMGKLLGHHCLSLSAIIANRISKQFSKDANAAIDRLIQKTLDIISGI
ncbi:nucleoside phosphorylase [Agriterribacter sp.]|uniref:nucleoside phosphorylase n=1 Tax=Agriterribacter sp. TaxID=2821509 RepID=UPI002BD2DFB3|nr:nucleoside phosphorylase [Agriterribacter sp.]HRO45075.1 nucleoside phosphorylase [Agriterribacter sp.]HRQ15484.1 nucleoside phosphorylase [Agriterribacter sp.]